MITKKEICDAHKLTGPHERKRALFRHEEDSARILSKLSRQLDKHSLRHELDKSWPFHLIIYTGKVLSAFAGGWDRSIDIMPLKQDGKPYAVKYERRFLTPEGAVNFILKKYSELV